MAGPSPDLGQALDDLAVICATPDGFTIDDLEQRLGERLWPLLLLILPLPFISPIPVPGLSTPFGVITAAIGIGILLGRAPTLPQQLRNLRCPPGLIARILTASVRQLARLRSCVRPRWTWLVEPRWTRVLAGVVIAVNGILLALPLPIPFSNALPAYTILLIGAGLAQRDGLTMGFGWLMGAATLGFFASLAWGAVAGAQWLLGS